MDRILMLVALGILSLGSFLHSEDPEPRNTPALRKGIEELQLGKPLEEIQEALKKSPYFKYRGPKDVSFLPLRSEPVIDIEGVRYFQRGIFQFREGRLVAMSLYVNPKYLDYPTLFQHFVSRYGSPQYLDPRSCYWEDGETRLALEKPLMIKFVERNALSSSKDGKATLPPSPEEMGRRSFLELF
ncbi:MAG: hypothetical protein N2442_05500 [Spirochaetes bacterium]|nr:hypothetical protein [Spirochaetota bacterium]